MNANELADELIEVTGELWISRQCANALRQFGLAESIIKQQQLQIEALEKLISEMKYEKSSGVYEMNNEPVAWLEPITGNVLKDVEYQNNPFANETGDWIPLYIHPVKEQGNPVAWRSQDPDGYWSVYQAPVEGAEPLYTGFKELTDEEILVAHVPLMAWEVFSSSLFMLEDNTITNDEFIKRCYEVVKARCNHPQPDYNQSNTQLHPQEKQSEPVSETGTFTAEMWEKLKPSSEPVAELVLEQMSVGDAAQLRVNWLTYPYPPVGSKLYTTPQTNPLSDEDLDKLIKDAENAGFMEMYIVGLIDGFDRARAILRKASEK